MVTRGQNTGSGHSGKRGQPPGAGRGGQPRDGGTSLQARSERGTQQAHRGPGLQGRDPSGEPDVILDVPHVHVDEIYFDLERLDAQLSLRSRVASLVQLTAGVRLHLGKLELDIKDVDAEALFKVRLENLYNILDRVFTTLDRNPEVLQGLLKTVNNAVDEVGQVGQQALGPGGAATEAVDQVGGAVQQAVGPGGAATEAAEGVGGAAQQAIRPGGAVSQAAGAAGQAAQGVENAAGQAAQGVENAAGQAGHGAGQGIGQASQAAAQDTQTVAQNPQDGARGTNRTNPPDEKKKGAPKRSPSAADKRGTKLGTAAARSVKRAATADTYLRLAEAALRLDISDDKQGPPVGDT